VPFCSRPPGHLRSHSLNFLTRDQGNQHVVFRGAGLRCCGSHWFTCCG
jgi:hypothetical protein